MTCIVSSGALNSTHSLLAKFMRHPDPHSHYMYTHQMVYSRTLQVTGAAR